MGSAQRGSASAAWANFGLRHVARAPSRYALSNWEALKRYTQDGELDIENNVRENALRGIALGRKNWMFLSSDRGGRTAAILLSFMATRYSHDVEPFAYLRDVLGRISDHPMSRIESLLPDRWQTLRAPTPDLTA